MDATKENPTPQRLHALLQNKNARIAAIAAACALIVAAIAIALAVPSCQNSGIKEPEVDTVPATMRADHVPALSVVLGRGDLVDIVDEKDGYYLVEYRGEKDVSPMYASISASSDEGADDDADAGTDGSASAAASSADSAESFIQQNENKARISKQGAAKLYIDKRYVRQAGQSAPEQRTGYVQSPTSLFATALLTGSPLTELEQNAEVTVLDEFADCLLVELSDKTRGYITAKAVGDAPVEEAPEVEQGWDGGAGYTYYAPQYGGGGGGSQGGGWQGGDIDLGGDSAGADGGDIVLPDPISASAASFAMAEALPVPFVERAYADEPPAEHATVLSDGMQTYLGWFDRDEVADIADVSCLTEDELALIPEGKTVVVMDGQWGLMDSNLVKLEGDEGYEPWEGYVASGAGLFAAYTLQGEPTVLELNQTVTVIDDLSTCYVVMLGEQLGYMAKADVSATPFEEPEPEEVIDYGNDYSYYGGGYYNPGYGGSSSPPVDAGSTGSSSDVIEGAIGGWTDEKL